MVTYMGSDERRRSGASSASNQRLRMLKTTLRFVVVLVRITDECHTGIDVSPVSSHTPDTYPQYDRKLSLSKKEFAQ